MIKIDTALAWRLILALRAAAREAPGPAVRADAAGDDGAAATLTLTAEGGWRSDPAAVPAAAAMFDLYTGACRLPQDRPLVLAHLGQSLDGRIATQSGHSRFVNGTENLLHLHRLRALADAVAVGAGTIQHDNPRLTVRDCPGASPMRVVIDPDRRLGDHFFVFHDAAAPTILVCAADNAGCQPAPGRAEVIGVGRRGAWLDAAEMLTVLAARGVRMLFVEGGGATVSRFLAAGLIDRLQITVAPVLIGSGRPGLSLPEIASMHDALRPPTRRFEMGDDVLFECRLRA